MVRSLMRQDRILHVFSMFKHFICFEVRLSGKSILGVHISNHLNCSISKFFVIFLQNWRGINVVIKHNSLDFHDKID